MNLAVRDIRHNFGAFALTTVGIGLLLMIVTGMGGIYRGHDGRRDRRGGPHRRGLVRDTERRLARGLPAAHQTATTGRQPKDGGASELAKKPWLEAVKSGIIIQPMKTESHGVAVHGNELQATVGPGGTPALEIHPQGWIRV
jgi:hypothetical protein